MVTLAEHAAQDLQCRACSHYTGDRRNCPYNDRSLAGDCKKFDLAAHAKEPAIATISDGSTASYYELPAGAAQLQDLISHRNMNAQMGEIFRATYRYGLASHSDQLRDAKKIKFYIEAEIARLQKIGGA